MPVWAVGAISPAVIKWSGIAIVALVAGWWVYGAGYDRAEDKWSALYNKREAQIVNATNAEMSRLQQAGALAKAIEAQRLAALAAENAALEQKIKELSDAADADPDRDRVCLSDGSRLRIDSIR